MKIFWKIFLKILFRVLRISFMACALVAAYMVFLHPQKIRDDFAAAMARAFPGAEVSTEIGETQSPDFFGLADLVFRNCSRAKITAEYADGGFYRSITLSYAENHIVSRLIEGDIAEVWPFEAEAEVSEAEIRRLFSSGSGYPLESMGFTDGHIVLSLKIPYQGGETTVGARYLVRPDGGNKLVFFPVESSLASPPGNTDSPPPEISPVHDIFGEFVLETNAVFGRTRDIGAVIILPDGGIRMTFTDALIME